MLFKKSYNTNQSRRINALLGCGKTCYHLPVVSNIPSKSEEIIN